jgi:integrase
MKRNKIIILPAINNCGGDINKDWYVLFSYRNPLSGKMKPFKKYNGINVYNDPELRMMAAQKLADEWKQKLLAGHNPFIDDERSVYEDQLQYNNAAMIYGKTKASNKTFRFFSSIYLQRKSQNIELDPDTISTYKSKLRTFDMWLEKKNIAWVDISAITNNDILAFFHYIINDRKLSGNSVGKYEQLIRVVFDTALAENAISINPVYNVPKCKTINDQTPRPIIEADINDFKNEIMRVDKQLWLAVCFEYYCFLRPGKELRWLKIQDIDFSRGVVDVDRFRSKTNLEKFPTIPMVFLDELQNTYRLHTYPRNWYVFSKNGSPGTQFLGKNNMRYRFREIRKRLNMPDLYKFYSWKHTGNSRAFDADISTRALSDQNGHSSFRTTEIYLKNKVRPVNKEIRYNFPPI